MFNEYRYAPITKFIGTYCHHYSQTIKYQWLNYFKMQLKDEKVVVNAHGFIHYEGLCTD